MKIVPASPAPSPPLLPASMSPGVFPYLGGSVLPDQLRSIVRTYEGAVVSGKMGVRLAKTVPGVLIDPAAYIPQPKDEADALFDFQDWLVRQRTAGVPLILTDTPRIQSRDNLALRKALARWDKIDEPTLVVLPIEPWWLQEQKGLPVLIEEVRAAGRPVALVLLHRFNGLDPTGAVAGLLKFISAVEPLPVILLRCDISAIGAVAHRAFAGFVGWSPNTRHGPLPMRRPDRAEDDERDDSPAVFVPALNNYTKASKLPAFARARRLEVLRCDDPVCGGQSLLEIAKLAEVNPQEARKLANMHNLASTELLARRIFSAAEPRDAWWETCRAGAMVSASLVNSAISLPSELWLRQWLKLGSPSHDYQSVG